MRKMKVFNLLSTVIFVTVLTLPAQAGIIGSDKCLIDTSTYSGCTANDVGVAAMRVINITDGCTGPTDTATVQLEVDITSGQPDRYGVGIHIDVGGGDAVATGNTCVHEALFDQALVDNSNMNATSGIGPFYNSPDDLVTNTCGSVGGKTTFTRRLVQGDIVAPPPSSTTALDIDIACSDTTDNTGGTANGYVDFGWAVGWTVDKAKACTTIAEAIADGPAKCQTGVQDTNDGLNLIPIGVPDMNTTITCSPSATEYNVLNCTVTYINNSPVGPADYLGFYVDYNSSQGILSNITSPTNSSGSLTDDTNVDDLAGRITWTVDDTVAIAPGETGSFTFDMNVTDFTADINISIIGVFDNGTSTTLQPSLYDEYILPVGDFGTLPVTIAYVYPQKVGSSLDVAFRTATEVGNIGFNIYAIKGHKWIKLNDALIEGALDSFEPKDYQVSLDLPENLKFKKIGVAGVDVNGVEDRHGAFKIAHESGVKEEVVPIKWAKVNKEVKKDKKARKAAKKAKRKSRRAAGKLTKELLEEETVNLEVSKDAIYRVTHEALVAAGIDFTNLKTKDIAISFRGEGVARYIENLDKKGKWTQESWIEFKGEAPKGSDTLYIKANNYQLDLNKELVVESAPIEPMTTKELVFEVNKRYSTALPGDDPFYESLFYAEGKTDAILNRNFKLNAVDDTEYEITVRLLATSDVPHHLIVSLNGKEKAVIRGEGISVMSVTFSVNGSMLNEGTNTISMHAIGEGEKYDTYRYDKTVVRYDDGESTVSSIPMISLDEKVEKKSIKPKRGTNYVIISHPLFMGEMLDHYMTQRMGEGWKIQLVNVEDIYDAYGYGRATPEAIKAYLKEAQDKGVTHVQLVGASSYDYHDYLGLDSVSFIPSIYVTTSGFLTYTPSDTMYVADETSIPQMAIGRWPVRTVENLKAVINKSLEWKISGQSVSHTALFIADKDDGKNDFAKQMKEMAQTFESGEHWTDITHVYLDNYITQYNDNMPVAVSATRDAIAQSFNGGPSIVSFSGHSSPSAWSYDGLLIQSDIGSIQNEGRAALVLPLACYTTYADSPSVNTLAHQLLASGEHGAVAVYGSTLFSAYAANGLITSKVIEHLFKGETIGESVLKAKNEMGTKYLDNILNGTLLGDVTLRLK